MKTAALVIVVGALALVAGCGRGRDKVGDAPRTVSSSATAGWQQVSTSGVTLQFPTDWKMISLSKDTFEQGAEKTFGNDPKFAAMRTQATEMAKQGSVKLFAFDPSTAGSGFATNCNVLVQDLPGPATLDEVAGASVRQLASMVATGTQPKLDYLNLKSGRVALIRSELRPPNPAVPTVVSLAYADVSGSKLAVVTFTAPVTDETRIRGVADQAMDTFRFSE